MEVKKRLAKLIDVKSIMTLMLTLVFCVMALCGVISGQDFLTIFVVIVGFYFGSQSQKKATGETVPEQAAVLTKAPVDEAMQNDVHPPDVVVEGFAKDTHAGGQ